MPNKKHFFLITAIVLLTIGLRFYRIGQPMFDRHHFRQTDTYAIVLNFMESGGDILRPQFYQTPQEENINGYYFGEFPIYEYLIYVLFLVFGESLILARMVNIILSGLAVIGVYLIGKKLANCRVGLLSAAAFALIPSSIFWGRAITPDWMALVSFIFATVFFLKEDTAQNKILTSLFLTVCILIKPFYLAFLGFQLFYLLFSKELKLEKALMQLAGIYLFPLGCYIAWRLWAGTFPEYTVDPDLSKLLYFRMGWWQYWHESRWIALFWQDHFFGEMLTTLGGFLALIGFVVLLIKRNKHTPAIISWLVGGLAISYLIAWGSKVHDYYLLPWLPLSVLLMGIGLEAIIKAGKKQLKDVNWDLKTILFSMMSGGAILFIVYFLGLAELNKYIAGYFAPQWYAIYTQDYQQELAEVKQLIPKNALTISLLKEYSPVFQNTLRRRGSIYDIKPNLACPPTEKIAEVIAYRRMLGAEYLIMDIKNDPYSLCSRQKLIKKLPNTLSRIYHGEVVDAYQLNQSVLVLKGQGDYLTLEAVDIPATAKLEVGDYSGRTETTIIDVNWQQAEANKYQASFTDTSGWKSFKIYNQSPQMFIQHPGWKIEGDFAVKR